jgi:hypothetical protein
MLHTSFFVHFTLEFRIIRYSLFYNNHDIYVVRYKLILEIIW